MQTEEKSPCNRLSNIYTGDFVTDNSYIKMIWWWIYNSYMNQFSYHSIWSFLYENHFMWASYAAKVSNVFNV